MNLERVIMAFPKTVYCRSFLVLLLFSKLFLLRLQHMIQSWTCTIFGSVNFGASTEFQGYRFFSVSWPAQLVPIVLITNM